VSQSKVTLKEIMTAVRELTFDRFIIPAFAIKAKAGFGVSIQPKLIDETETTLVKRGSYLTLWEKQGEEQNNIIEIDLQERTLEEVMERLIEEGIVVAYTPYFRGAEKGTTLIKVTKELDEDFTAFRKYFFSDEEIMHVVVRYYERVLGIRGEITDEVISQLKRPSEQHLAIWVAYHLVDKRRLYENAASSIGQSFTDGSDYAGSSEASIGASTHTSVQIGSVFSITEDPTGGYFYEDFNRIGSDNVWGDRYSFWYKLMLYLRGLLESEFGDFSLRKDNIMQGTIELERALDFRSYFDSYPFTLSPLARGILSKVP
jgi:hypothetical protein